MSADIHPSIFSRQMEAIVYIILKALSVWLLLGIRTVLSKLLIVLQSNKGLLETFRHGQVLNTISHTSESRQIEEKDFHFNFLTETLMLFDSFHY